MAILGLFIICYVGVTFITCAARPPAPATPTTMYEAIRLRCPKVETFKDETIFKVCNDIEKIQSVTSLQSGTEVRCLLYYSTFLTVCQNIENINATISKELLSSYDLNTVCDNNTSILNKTNSDILLKIIKNKEDCEKLCGDEMGMGLVNSVCTFSYYYSQLNEKLAPSVKKQNPQTEETRAVQLKTEASDSKSKPNIEQSQAASALDEKNTKQVVNIKPITAEESINPLADKKVELSGSSNKNNAATTSENHDIKNATSTATRDESVAEATYNQKVGDTESKITAVSSREQASESNAQPPPPSENVEVGEDVDVPPSNNDDVIQEPVNGDEVVGNDDVDDGDEEIPQAEKEKKMSKPATIDETEAVNYATEMDGDSYFFTYFMLLCVIFIAGYVCYHNKNKILALILEGQRGKKPQRGKRPNSANYHKLDSNLEEAISSSCSKNASNVIY